MVSLTVAGSRGRRLSPYAPHRRQLMHVEQRTEIAQARCCSSKASWRGSSELTDARDQRGSGDSQEVQTLLDLAYPEADQAAQKVL